MGKLFVVILVFCISFLRSNEGLTGIPRITGGQRDVYHFALSTQCIVGPGTLCMGNMISTSWAVTAAHCVPLPGTLGEYIFSGGLFKCDPLHNIGRSSEVVKHPQYTIGLIGGHDIAMVRLKSSEVFAAGISLLARHAWKPIYNDLIECHVIGMGIRMSEIVAGDPSHEWQYTKIRIFDPPTAISNYDRWAQKLEPDWVKEYKEGFYAINVTASYGNCGNLPHWLRRRVLCTMGNRIGIRLSETRFPITEWSLKTGGGDTSPDPDADAEADADAAADESRTVTQKIRAKRQSDTREPDEYYDEVVPFKHKGQAFDTPVVALRKGPCYGDGGAPLFCTNEHMLFGVLSMIAPLRPGMERVPFYNTCASDDYMDVYTYLCPYYGWMQSIAKINIFIPPEGCSTSKTHYNLVFLAESLLLILITRMMLAKHNSIFDKF